MSDAGDDDGALVGALSVISVPLAGKKLTKKLHKVVKKAAASKILKRGVKEVVKALRKSEKLKGCVAARAHAWSATRARSLQRASLAQLTHTHTHNTPLTRLLSVPQAVHHCGRHLPH